MNYFELHIGDYAEATSHLTFVEDAAYGRMMRKYYATELPMPADISEVQRLVGARNREEKSAVERVLKEFFYLADDGWRNKRCDAEIEKFLEGEPERAIKKANESNRTKRHREERSALFKRVTDAGHHAPWNIGITELRELANRVNPVAEPLQVPLPVTQPVTAPATPVTATQSPDTRHQTPDTNIYKDLSLSFSTPVPVDNSRDDFLERKSKIVSLLTPLGVSPFDINHEQCDVWARNRSVTDKILTDAVAKAKPHKPGKISPKYLAPIIAELLAELVITPEKHWSKSWKGIEERAVEFEFTQGDDEPGWSFRDRVYAEARNRGEEIP